MLGAAVVVGVALGLRGLVRKFRHLQKILEIIPNTRHTEPHLLGLVRNAVPAPELEHGGFEELKVALLFTLQKPDLEKVYRIDNV